MTEGGVLGATRGGDWAAALESIRTRVTEDVAAGALKKRAPRELVYVLHTSESRLRDALVVELYVRERGATSTLKMARYGGAREERSLLGAEDKGIVALLDAAGRARTVSEAGRAPAMGRIGVPSAYHSLLLPQLCATGRFFAQESLFSAPEPLCWADDDALLDLELCVQPDGDDWLLDGVLTDGQRRLGVRDLALVLSAGLLLDGAVFRGHELGAHFEWVYRLRRQGAIQIPAAARDEMLLRLARIPDLPPLTLPPELHWSVLRPKPSVTVVLEADPDDERHLWAELRFAYAEHEVSASDRSSGIPDATGRRFFRRAAQAERALVSEWNELLEAVGARPSGPERVRLKRRVVGDVITQAGDKGWTVNAEGCQVRMPKQIFGSASFKTDWFDLDVSVQFGDVEVDIGSLLAHAGERFVPLPDGSKGVVTQALQRCLKLAKLGEARDGKVQFQGAQAGVVDALLMTLDASTSDRAFERYRSRLKRPVAPEGTLSTPRAFSGTLRSYQLEGYHWMHSVASLGLGCCLADDMGLGKTVQVYALLCRWHGQRKASSRGTSLIVAPKSLVYNWVDEGRKFAPTLSVVPYTGREREALDGRLRRFDVVVTTYGTMKRDIMSLRKVDFHGIVLDEAQAIKSPYSQTSKACRLLRGRHRVALSGTPVENRSEELWSMFEFLNPGLLGRLSEFQSAFSGEDDERTQLLGAALGPLMLRRTKMEVLRDLPKKTEQDIRVELTGEHAKIYRSVLHHFRQKMLEVEGRAKNVHALEALLRLRQAACHPGLIRPEWRSVKSDKISRLVEQAESLVAAGDKILVFSQFTSLLSIVEDELKSRGVVYDRLDGSTSDREGVVKRFQDREEGAVFLLSLKAANCGLNLTCSNYVFLLDPWWNPAVEAQAVDRVYRIGQRRAIFAYRMISMGTVEEKVQKLQAQKRRLAESLVPETANAPKFSMEDLEQLLS